ncbi:unnamed protein product, partial [Rotaria sordida]
MLIEDIRKFVVEYCTQMLERWHMSDLWIVSVYVTPYILFYIGIGLHFLSGSSPNLFTAASAKNLSAAILYRPYWLLYSIADDEKKDLDTIIESKSSTASEVAEATATHVLLAFHMLFINILILNLLIAVFNFTINDVQAKSEYLWRYQRYELIREYFEKPFFAFPPLSILGYLGPLLKWILHRRNVLRLF